METNESSLNHTSMSTQAQPQQASPANSRPLIFIVISVLLTAMIIGPAVYFWQKSASEKAISSLEQKITSLEKQISMINETKSNPQLSPTLESSPTPTNESSANLKTYSNGKYKFSFSYPQNWKINDVYQDPDAPIFLSNIANGHTISIHVYRVTGFGYCYKYGEQKEIFVGTKVATTADGVGPSEMCDKPEEFTNRGNTFVLIPLEDKPEGLPANQILISYDYPLDDINLAKSNLEQILSTFKFTD